MPQIMLLSTAESDIKDCLLMALSEELLNIAPYVLIEPELCSEAILRAPVVLIIRDLPYSPLCYDVSPS